MYLAADNGQLASKLGAGGAEGILSAIKTPQKSQIVLQQGLPAHLQIQW